jgi:hypothetical protein
MRLRCGKIKDAHKMLMGKIFENCPEEGRGGEGGGIFRTEIHIYTYLNIEYCVRLRMYLSILCRCGNGNTLCKNSKIDLNEMGSEGVRNLN